MRAHVIARIAGRVGRRQAKCRAGRRDGRGRRHRRCVGVRRRHVQRAAAIDARALDKHVARPVDRRRKVAVDGDRGVAGALGAQPYLTFTCGAGLFDAAHHLGRRTDRDLRAIDDAQPAALGRAAFATGRTRAGFEHHGAAFAAGADRFGHVLGGACVQLGAGFEQQIAGAGRHAIDVVERAPCAQFDAATALGTRRVQRAADGERAGVGRDRDGLRLHIGIEAGVAVAYTRLPAAREVAGQRSDAVQARCGMGVDGEAAAGRAACGLRTQHAGRDLDVAFRRGQRDRSGAAAARRRHIDTRAAGQADVALARHDRDVAARRRDRLAQIVLGRTGDVEGSAAGQANVAVRAQADAARRQHDARSQVDARRIDGERSADASLHRRCRAAALDGHRAVAADARAGAGIRRHLRRGDGERICSEVMVAGAGQAYALLRVQLHRVEALHREAARIAGRVRRRTEHDGLRIHRQRAAASGRRQHGRGCRRVRQLHLARHDVLSERAVVVTDDAGGVDAQQVQRVAAQRHVAIHVQAAVGTQGQSRRIAQCGQLRIVETQARRVGTDFADTDGRGSQRQRPAFGRQRDDRAQVSRVARAVEHHGAAFDARTVSQHQFAACAGRRVAPDQRAVGGADAQCRTIGVGAAAGDAQRLRIRPADRAAGRHLAARLQHHRVARHQHQIGRGKRRTGRVVDAHSGRPAYQLPGRVELSYIDQRVAAVLVAAAARATERDAFRIERIELGDRYADLAVARAGALAEQGERLRRDVDLGTARTGRACRVEHAVERQRTPDLQGQATGVSRAAAVVEHVAGLRNQIFSARAHLFGAQQFGGEGLAAGRARTAHRLRSAHADLSRTIRTQHGLAGGQRLVARLQRDQESTRQQRVASWQQGVGAGRQAVRRSEYLHRLADLQAIGFLRPGRQVVRRIAAADGRHDGVSVLRAGQDVLRAAAAGDPFPGLQIAAAGQIDPRFGLAVGGVPQHDVVGVQRDALLRRAVEFDASVGADQIQPVATAQCGLTEGQQQAVGRHRGDAAGSQFDRAARGRRARAAGVGRRDGLRLQRYVSERRDQATVLHDVRCCQRQRAERRIHRTGRTAGRFDAQCAARVVVDFEGVVRRRGRIDLGRTQRKIAAGDKARTVAQIGRRSAGTQVALCGQRHLRKAAGRQIAGHVDQIGRQRERAVTGLDRGRPGVVLLHAADIGPVEHRGRQLHVCPVGTGDIGRVEHHAAGHGLRHVLAEAQRAGVATIATHRQRQVGDAAAVQCVEREHAAPGIGRRARCRTG